ncbi:uncharacterized protein LOC108627195 [Ceratina calcarata]|uniref:Uncharacterized protein LOC108627195 n=1 Tax=Ceratina calcarata TaxID=156304 RepID=A0AAJ7J4A7_9HYME|nr:uncharacterized protein LOC108627195 [Ceratina calcarata]
MCYVLGREELRRKDPTEFYSVVFLLTRYTLHSKIQTRVIYHALVSYMEMLLEMHSVEDIKLFKEMIVKLGNRLQTGYKEPVKELILTCRTILIKEDVPEASRLMLLYVIDLERRGFSHLPNYLKAFYKSQLGEEYEEPLLN